LWSSAPQISTSANEVDAAGWDYGVRVSYLRELCA
jgi:hypothetical protein